MLIGPSIPTTAAYNRWKLSPEWKWVQTLKEPPRSAYERSRLTTRQQWLLDDLGVTLKTSQGRFDALRYQNPLQTDAAPPSVSVKPQPPKQSRPQPPKQSRPQPPKQQQQPPRPSKSSDDDNGPLPPLPARDDTPSPEQLASVIERLERDLASVTRERDQLKQILELQRQQTPLVPQPPPPPSSVQTTDKGQVADLLQSLRAKSKQLRPAPLPASPPTASSSSGPRNVLSDALETRMRGLRKSVEKGGGDGADWDDANAPIQCEMCYSEGTMQCKDCKIALYCGPACQTAHWNTLHRHVCLPVEQRVSK